MFNISGLFSKEAIVRRLKASQPIKTPVLDLIFTRRPQVPLAVVGTDMVKSVIRALPVIRRGAPSISAVSESGGIAFYEPLPIRPHKMVTGQDLNNLKMLGTSSRELWASEKQRQLQDVVRKTSEGMCATSLSGKLTWPIQLENGTFETWEVDFGTPKSYVPDELWDATATVKNAFETLQNMEESIQDDGYGSTVEIWAGKKAYSQLLSIVEGSKTTAKIRVEMSEKGIDIGGYLVKRRSEKNYNPETKAMVPVVADTAIKMIATDAGMMMPYCAIDDLDANLQPLPFFVKPVQIADPSGYKLIGESKPFPIPNVDGICDATVVSS